MPKMKTHSGTKKRFSATGNGKFVFKKSGRGHLLSKKKSTRLRRLRQKGMIQTSFEARMRALLPYA
ncbi:MAG: 50S ribosomal protein L35 [Thermovirgaceae bacterium]|nr:50S ribosomal protein L35 [Thermovirgaceae bacterium]